MLRLPFPFSSFEFLAEKLGPGKTTYTFSLTFRFLPRPFSVLPAGGGGDQAEMESSLALAENVYVILPRPRKIDFFAQI
jgi:hypothetical protein